MRSAGLFDRMFFVHIALTATQFREEEVNYIQIVYRHDGQVTRLDVGPFVSQKHAELMTKYLEFLVGEKIHELETSVFAANESEFSALDFNLFTSILIEHTIREMFGGSDVQLDIL